MFFSQVFPVLRFWGINKLQNLRHHYRHYCKLEVAHSIISLES